MWMGPRLEQRKSRGVMTTGRSVGGAARGPITLSAGSSPAVPVPYSESTKKDTLRRMLSNRDREITEMKAWHDAWELTTWSIADLRKYRRLDTERRMIRERIKELGRKVGA